MESMSSLFTPIMVIGTILAMIFAAGAFWNSLARRRSLEQAEPAAAEEKIVFKPMPTSPPSPSAPSAASAPPPKPTAEPLFRQVRPSGVVESSNVQADDEDEMYVWE